MKKKHHITDLFLESFIFAIYVEYNLAKKKIIKIGFYKIIYFSIYLIEFDSTTKKNQKLTHITKSYLQKKHRIKLKPKE